MQPDPGSKRRARNPRTPIDWDASESVDSEHHQADGDICDRPENSFPDKDDSEDLSDGRPAPKDFWAIARDLLIRYQKVPRTTLHVSNEEDNPPIPLKYLDIMRATQTDLDH